MDDDKSIPLKRLRLWPGVVIVVLQWLLRFAGPIVMPESLAVAVIGGLVGGLAIVVWWVFFSRARWSERVGAIALMAIALLATRRFIHVSIATGMMGMMFPIYAVPVLSLAFVIWAVATRRLPDGLRRASMVATILLACGAWTLVRTGGFTANLHHDFAWRWAATPEDRLVAQASDEPATVPKVPAGAKTAVAWPGFRGPVRDGIVHGARIATDWSAAPPVELWRRAIGPGWSSFAVRGEFVYTQEQRGEEEEVACYNLTTGKPVWRHRDATRFWESNGGAGPRATPTLSNGRVYTFGATGILNALDADDGSVVWSRNVASDVGAKVPGWGFASSPLVVDDEVVVHARVLVAYNCGNGDQRWIGPARGGGYSSPHLLMVDGVAQILQMSGAGATSVAPADGTPLWQHDWPGTPIVQPAQVAGDAVLISTTGSSGGIGTRRLALTQGSGGWTVREYWTSNGLKPYFNDFVVHKGHAFGFDGSILACIDLEDGKRKWKGGRYGNGQLVLLADQELLLVLSEEGELALVGATTDEFKELGRFPAIKGKTWNHPVLVDDVLLVRNGLEMAAFRLARANR